MSTEDLETMVRSKDWDAPLAAAALGPAATERLLALLSDDDPEVRELTISCLAKTKDPRALPGLVRGLSDPDFPVRAAAGNVLSVQHDASILPALHEGMRANPYRDAREQIPLIIGLIGDPVSLPVLGERLAVTRQRLIQHNIRLAMARLGDRRKKEYVARLLRLPDVAGRLQAVRDVAYVMDPELGRRLAPLLDDRQVAYAVGLSGYEQEARICDAVVNAVAEIYAHPFAFETGSQMVYDDGQLAEVKRFLDAQPPADAETGEQGKPPPGPAESRVSPG